MARCGAAPRKVGGTRFAIDVYYEEMENQKDPESKEVRSEGFGKFQRFVHKLGIDSLTAEEKVAWLQKLDFEKFMQLVSRANGRLRAVGSIQRWADKGTRTVVSSLVMGTALESPEDAEQELKIVYLQMQREITPETLKFWAAKLYIALVFAHIFPDGNGRTGRHIYSLLTRGGSPRESLSIERTPEVGELCWRMNGQGIGEVFGAHGLPGKDFPEYWGDKEVFSTGMTSHLKYIAGKETLESTGKTVTEKEIDTTQFSGEQKATFLRKYAEIRREWYHKVVKAVDTYPGYVTDMLDKGVKREQQE